MKGKKGLRVVEASPEEEERRRVLQEALGYLLPRTKTAAAVERLLDRFGSFEGIFLAPEEELVSLLGEEAGHYLKVTTQLARLYLEDKSRDIRRVYDTKSAVELFRPKFLGRTTEAVGLMLLDGRGRLLYNDILAEGSVTAVPIYIRRLVQLCIRYNAQNVLLAHNHPSGNPAPSRNDIVATRQVELTLECMEATLNDHIIFAGEDYFSFLTSGWMTGAKQQAQATRQREMERARQQELALIRGEEEPTEEEDS